LSLFAGSDAATTYTFTKAGDVKIRLGTGGITVGNGTTSNISSVGAPATASIVLGTGAINLGNAATLKLAIGAKIGVFTNSPGTIETAGITDSVGGAVVSGASAVLTNGSGTLTGSGGEAILTGAAAGDSAIAAGAAFVGGA
jgi:hypothetical protein